MRTPAFDKHRVPTASQRTPQSGVDGLVRRLVKQIESDPPASTVAANSDSAAVMLDVQVDGVRCLLTRVQDRRPLVLSPREREIARMVARGYPNKTIAGVLEISSWTVGTYLRRIFAKLNVGTRAAMVAQLMVEGLLKE